jgi:hypothetical protein
MCKESARAEESGKRASEPNQEQNTGGPGGKEMSLCCSEMMAKMMSARGSNFPAGEMMGKMMNACGSEPDQEESSGENKESAGTSVFNMPGCCGPKMMEMMGAMAKTCCDGKAEDKSDSCGQKKSAEAE